MDYKKIFFSLVKMLLVILFLLVAFFIIQQKSKDIRRGDSEMSGINRVKQGDEQMDNFNDKVTDDKIKNNIFKESEDNFIINKKLLAAGEQKINFPKRCHYQEKTNENGVEKGFAFSYVSDDRKCPYLVIKSKNVRIKDGWWGLTWVEKRNGKIRQTYGGNKQQWQKVSEHIYKSTIYTNIECSGSIETSIVYEFPKKSILDFAYIEVYSKESNFGEGDFDDICEPKQSVVDAKVNKISKEDHKIEIEFLQGMFKNYLKNI